MKLTFLITFKHQAPSSEALEMSPIKAQVGSEVNLQGTKESDNPMFRCSFCCQPSVGDAGAPVFRLIPTKDLGVDGGPTERVKCHKLKFAKYSRQC